jgi:putative CocE/NonD family hydrolase
VTIDPARRVQALYVPVSDGVRLAVDVWLPVERIALGERVGTEFRATRYHRTALPPGPQPEADSNHAAGELWNSAGFALVVVDARGTGASFGSRTMELGPREIADYGELIDWVAAQPWSNGRVGLFGASYDGQAAELVAGLGNPHVTAVAALFSPVDPYRELFYPGGCATGGRFARWMCESQIKDGVAGAVERLSELTGRPAGEIASPTPVKGVDGPDGPALLQAAIGEHQANVDMQQLLGRAAFSDDCLPGLDWQATTPVGVRQAIEATGVPMLIRAGWLDGAFAAGALRRLATFANQQEVEIGPWGHGGRTYADTLRPDGTLAGDRLVPEGQDRRLVEFFTRYVERAEAPDGKRNLTFGTLGTDQWQAVSSWPPEGACLRGAGASPRQADWHRTPARQRTCATSSSPRRRPAPRIDGSRSTSAGARRTPIAGTRTRRC